MNCVRNVFRGSKGSTTSFELRESAPKIDLAHSKRQNEAGGRTKQECKRRMANEAHATERAAMQL
jgi:hypothetical protein